MFPNSQHIVDEEKEMIEKIDAMTIVFNGMKLHNFSFVNSTENRMG